MQAHRQDSLMDSLKPPLWTSKVLFTTELFFISLMLFLLPEFSTYSFTICHHSLIPIPSHCLCLPTLQLLITYSKSYSQVTSQLSFSVFLVLFPLELACLRICMYTSDWHLCDSLLKNLATGLYYNLKN